MTVVELAKWTGAYAVTKLVGRQEKLNQIHEAIAAAGNAPQLIYITGEGGIGKTRLLREALAQVRDQKQGYRVAADLVDVYDLDTHSVAGLTERIVAVLHPSDGEFAHYRRLRDELTRSESTGIHTGERDLHDELAKAFVKDLATFAARHHVIIALDTAERMAYATEVSAPSATVAQGWLWLAGQMQYMNHVTWLIAGREPATQTLLDFVPGTIARTDVRLDQLDEEASISYFDAAVDVARANGDVKTAEQLAALPPDFRKEAAGYARGRPLLLALITDLVLVQNLPAAQKFLADSRSPHRPDEPIEQAIIRRLIETPGMGRFLIAAGRLRKGFDAALMLEALKSSQPDVTLAEVEQQIAQFRKLSFVKDRDGRLFLHDVMYEMLDAQVYRKATDRAAAGEFYNAIIAYNNLQQQRLEEDTERVYRPVESERRPEALDGAALVELNRRRRALLTERLYYLLRLEAVRGFRHYFRVTFDAVLSSDVTLDIALESEILAFLNERDPERRATFVDGLERAVCEAVARLRPVARQVAAGQYTRAIQLAEALRQEPGALAIGGPGTEALLSIWEAYARIYRAGPGDMERARSLLGHAIETLDAIIRENDPNHPSRVWRARGGLAFAYMVRGYLYWSRGALEAATHDYTRSVLLGREVRVNVNLATALNDMGFVRAEAGDIGDARALVEEALRLRRQRGPRAPAAFSINTLARINILEGQYRTAMEQSSIALATFSALEHKRGETLALIALAEAKRRYASNSPHLTQQEWSNLLKEANGHARAALKLAEDLGEKLRQVAALIEVGCAARDMLRLLIGQQATLDSAEIARLIDESRAALQQAAELAGDLFMYRKLDALVNLGYLWYYVRDLEQAQAAIQHASEAFPREYWLVLSTGEPAIDRERATVQIWTQLGKLHTLRGHIAFDRYREKEAQRLREKEAQRLPEKEAQLLKEAQQSLQEAIENYLLSLKYNALYGPDHPGMRLMRDQVYDRLKEASYNDLQRISEYVVTAEQKYHIPDSALRGLLRSRALWIAE